MNYIRFQSPEGPHWGLVREAGVIALDGAPYLGGRESRQTYPLDALQLLAPVEPSKVVCIGRNYADHAAELGNIAPSEPMFFLKPPTALVGHGGAIEIRYPEHAIHWEGELAVVIGKPTRDVSQEEAMDSVYGYTIANDVSDRDFQKTDAPFGFGRGKCFDTFLPCGPALVTEGIDPRDAHITLTCNGEVRQSDSTSLMIHPLPKLISYLSRIMTLLPGDLVLTGTPKGVGAMKPGDVVEISIPGIGKLSSPVK